MYEGIPVTYSAKLRKLVTLADKKHLIPYINEVDGFATLVYGTEGFIVSDTLEAPNLSRLTQMGNLPYGKTGRLLMPFTSDQMLAKLVTNGKYNGFFNGMGMFIDNPKFKVSSLFGLGEDKPNYRYINFVLMECGYPARFKMDHMGSLLTEV